MDKGIEHDPILVYRSPEAMEHTVDPQEHFIQMSDVARLRPASAQLSDDVAPELQAPFPDALMRDADAPVGHDQLHLAQAQAKHMGTARDYG